MFLYNMTFETAKAVENLLQGWDYVLEYDFDSELYKLAIPDNVPVKLEYWGGTDRTVTLSLGDDFEILSLDEVEVSLI